MNRAAPNLQFVIPAKAGIHWFFDGRKMDPRFRGDDASDALMTYELYSRPREAATVWLRFSKWTAAHRAPPFSLRNCASARGYFAARVTHSIDTFLL
jgi:hypothetical protein